MELETERTLIPVAEGFDAAAVKEALRETRRRVTRRYYYLFGHGLDVRQYCRHASQGSHALVIEPAIDPT